MIKVETNKETVYKWSNMENNDPAMYHRQTGSSSLGERELEERKRDETDMG